MLIISLSYSTISLLDGRLGTAQEVALPGRQHELAHAGVGDRDMLVRIQQYIATTTPEMRCPWNSRVVVITIEDHFPECDAIPGLELKAKQHEEVEAEKLELILKRDRIELKYLEEKRTAEHLQARRV